MRGSLSRLGVLVLLGAALTLVALTFDSPTLFVPGTGLLALAAGAAGWAGAAQLGLGLTRRPAAQRVSEGEPLNVVLELRRRILRPRNVVVYEPLLGQPRPLVLPDGEARTALRFEVAFARRGRHRLEPPAAWVSDPFGLLWLNRRGRGDGGEVLVLPSVSRVQWRSRRPVGERGDPRRGAGDPPAAVEIDGVRPYRPGTPASRIHWASAARGAGLMERRLRADSDELPLVVLDPAAPLHEEHLDAAVRAAASLSMSLASDGGCRLMIAGHGPPLTLRRDLAAWAGAHEALALTVADRTRLPGQGIRPPGAPLVIYVCADAPAELVFGARPGQISLLVLPDEVAGGGAAELRVAGCSGRRITAARDRAA